MRWTQKLMRAVAEEERAELGLQPFDSLDPYELAAAHGIPVYSIASFTSFGLSPDAIVHFTADRAGTWSAILVPLGSARVIVENDSHQLMRRHSNIAHELGHHLLEHAFDEVVLGEATSGCSTRARRSRRPSSPESA